MSPARRLWSAYETIHALVYFAPEPAERFTALGLKGFWMGYFASRSAPMGIVPPEVVTATFHGFAPWMVERALPDAWLHATPQQVLDARYEGVAAALHRVLGDDDLTPVAALARAATDACDGSGRALFAAHAALPWPDDPLLSLWHATTLLREHRGDGHIAVLTAHGIDGAMSQVLQVERGVAEKADLMKTRGWSEDDWRAAEARIAALGITAAVRAAIEDRTDDLSIADDELADALQPVAARVAAAGDIRFPNPIGLPPRPAA
jgi:hypothetical protein